MLRQGKLDQLDLENLIEEVDDMRKSEYRRLHTHLTQLLMHILKCQMQPQREDLHDLTDWHSSWQVSIRKQRPMIEKVLRDSPGLKPQLQETYSSAYQLARKLAAAEMHCKAERFPSGCPWDYKQAMDEDFLPE